MKRNYDMKQGIFVFLMAMGALLLASCEADPVDTTRGELPRAVGEYLCTFEKHTISDQYCSNGSNRR